MLSLLWERPPMAAVPKFISLSFSTYRMLMEAYSVCSAGCTLYGFKADRNAKIGTPPRLVSVTGGQECRSILSVLFFLRSFLVSIRIHFRTFDTHRADCRQSKHAYRHICVLCAKYSMLNSLLSIQDSRITSAAQRFFDKHNNISTELD